MNPNPGAWGVNDPKCDNPTQLELARIMDPVAFDPRAVPENLGQSWDQFERQQTALDHAKRVLDAGWVHSDPANWVAVTVEHSKALNPRPPRKVVHHKACQALTRIQPRSTVSDPLRKSEAARLLASGYVSCGHCRRRRLYDGFPPPHSDE
jgi:hypothetical protein